MIAFLRNLFLHDFWLKLFSLALAILIWQTVWLTLRKEVMPVTSFVNTTAERTFFSVPILPVSSTGDVREYRVRPAEIEVTVRGEAKVLETLQSRDIRAIVNLTGFENGGDVRRPVEVSTPSGVTHTSIVPAEAQIVPPIRK